MKNHTSLRLSIILGCVWLAVASPISGQETETDKASTKKAQGSFKAGIVSAGKLGYNNLEPSDTETGYSVGASLDFKVGRALSFGGFVDLNGLGLESGGHASYIVWGGEGFLTIPSSNEGFIFRPGAGFGLGIFNDRQSIGGGEHLVFKPFVQVMHMSPKRPGLLLEIALFIPVSDQTSNDGFESSNFTVIRGGIRF